MPKTLVWDNESAVGLRKAGRPVLTEAMNGLPPNPGHGITKVVVTCQGRVVVEYDRSRGFGTITADQHVTAADRLRE